MSRAELRTAVDEDLDALTENPTSALDELIDDWSSSRRRLFAMVGWAGAGLLAIGVFGLLFSFLYPVLAALTGGALANMRVAGVAVLAGFALFGLIVRHIRRTQYPSRRRAQWLLWLASIACGFLVVVFSGALFVGEQFPSNQFPIFVRFVLPAVGGVAVAMFVVFGVAIGIGYVPSRGRTLARWIALIALVAVPVYTIAPDYVWIGIVAGVVIAWGVDLLVKFAISRPDVPNEAFAACLVTGICAAAMWVVLLLVRYALRFVVALFAIGASANR